MARKSRSREQVDDASPPAFSPPEGRGESKVLGGPKLWKAVAHPTRLALLRLLGDEAKTNEELADLLGMASGALHYHTRRLLEAGLVEPAGTRRAGPRVEKLYRRSAATYQIPLVDKDEAPPLSAILRNGLEVYEATWAAQSDHNFDQLGYNLVYDLRPEDEAAFFQEVKRLAERFERTGQATEGTPTRMVALTVLIHRVEHGSG